MKLSTRARYALRMMVVFARSSDEHPVSLREVSDATGISRRYLEQLVIGLKRAELVKGYSGKTGGYRLCRAPQDIRIGAIVTAALGPINIVDCVLKTDSCDKSNSCECRLIYVLINHRINQLLNEFTLADMTDEATLLRLISEHLGPDSPILRRLPPEES